MGDIDIISLLVPLALEVLDRTGHHQWNVTERAIPG